MFKSLLKLSGLFYGILYNTNNCVEFDVDSKEHSKHLTFLNPDNLLVVKVTNPKKYNLGDIKIGNLVDNGKCDYKSRHVVVDHSKEKKIVKVVTDFDEKASLISEYIETEPGVYKELKRESFNIDLNEDLLPEHVYSFYDPGHKMDKIRVKNTKPHLKIGKVTINDHVVEEIPNTLERFIYIWNSDDGTKTIKIDTHLNDNSLVSHTFVEDTPGSGKFLHRPGCPVSPGGISDCRDKVRDI